MPVSDIHALRVENFMLSLPSVLAEDEELSALARAAAEQFDALIRSTGRASVLINIDTLPEAVLDILARDFRVDWYDSNATPERKRQQIRTAFDVHRHKGTKNAVETAVSAIVPGATVEEWFEYNGEPYCFRIVIETDGHNLGVADQQRLLLNVQYYKNARSRLESIHYRLNPNPAPAPLRITPVTGDAYFRITVPAPSMESVYEHMLFVTDDGNVYEYAEEGDTCYEVDADGNLYYLRDENEPPPTFIIEDNGALYREEEA